MGPYSFFALLSRMKYIDRWGLMRNAYPETLSEHTLQTAYIAHALCVLSGVDPAQAVLCALYHDCSEILTGDLPTPIKYYNEEIKESYKQIEKVAADRLLRSLPQDLQPAYQPCFFEADPQVLRMVKAADKISALIKCIEELRMGNGDFVKAKEAQLQALHAMQLPAVERFLQEFLPAYEMTLDELDLGTAGSPPDDARGAGR